MIWNQQYTKEEYMTKKEELMQKLPLRKTFDELADWYTQFLEEHCIEPATNIQNCNGVT